MITVFTIVGLAVAGYILAQQPVRSRLAQATAARAGRLRARLGLQTVRVLQRQVVAAVEQRALASISGIYLPTDISVRVNMGDFRELESLVDQVARETAELIVELSERKTNTKLLGDPVVKIRPDRRVPPGTVKVQASVSAPTTHVKRTTATAKLRDREAEEGLTLQIDGRDVPIKDRLVLGRSAEADCRIVDETISREHALISVDDDGLVWIEDVGSSNGTFVNDREIDGRSRLTTRDRLRFGDELIGNIKDRRRTRRMVEAAMN